MLEGRSPPLEADPERCSCRCTKARAKGQAGCGSLPSPESRAPSGQKEQDERRYAWRRSRSNCVLQACKRMRGVGVGRMQHLVPSVLCWCGPGGWAGEGWGESDPPCDECVRSGSCAQILSLLAASNRTVPLVMKTPAKPGARSREELRAPEAVRAQSQRPLTP